MPSDYSAKGFAPFKSSIWIIYVRLVRVDWASDYFNLSKVDWASDYFNLSKAILSGGI